VEIQCVLSMSKAGSDFRSNHARAPEEPWRIRQTRECEPHSVASNDSFEAVRGVLAEQGHRPLLPAHLLRQHRWLRAGARLRRILSPRELHEEGPGTSEGDWHDEAPRTCGRRRLAPRGDRGSLGRQSGVSASRGVAASVERLDVAPRESRVSAEHFPYRIRALPPFEGPFEASRLAADGCEVLFASYPAGTSIDAHTHPTENCGVITRGELILSTKGGESRYGPGEWYHLLPGEEHAARFEVETSEIEFWFTG